MEDLKLRVSNWRHPQCIVQIEDLTRSSISEENYESFKIPQQNNIHEVLYGLSSHKNENHSNTTKPTKMLQSKDWF